MKNISLYDSPTSIASNKMQRMRDGIAKENTSLNDPNGSALYEDVLDLSAHLLSEKRSLSLEKEQTDNFLLLTKQQKMMIQINQAKDITSNIQALIVRYNGGNYESKDRLDTELKAYLSQIGSILNGKYGGLSTLSGAAIKTDAVCDLTKLDLLTSEGILQYDYYTGGKGDVSVQINEDTDVNLYGITANHTAFAKTIQAIRLCLAFSPVARDFNVLNQSSAELTQAIDFCKSAVAIDYPEALQKVSVEVDKIKDALSQVPVKIQQEVSFQEEMRGQDMMISLINLQSLQSALQITEYLLMQEQHSLRRFADEIGRLN